MVAEILPGKVMTTATMTTTMPDATMTEAIVAVTMSILPTAALANAWIHPSTVVSTLTTILLVITGQDKVTATIPMSAS